jgi:hypothetical protein
MMTKTKPILITLSLISSLLQTNIPAVAQQPVYEIVVNSNEDGQINPDEQLTFREALALANGTISPSQLSNREQQQIKIQDGADNSLITFNLPPDDATIFLSQSLPPIVSSGLTIDGTTNSGYQSAVSSSSEVILIPRPIVALTPQQGQEIPRGLVILSDRVTVKGLSIYGFNSSNHQIVSSADIFISDSLPLSPQKSAPPRQIVLEDNWLGIAPAQTKTTATSGFGIVVFNSIDTVIRRNFIANHDGSAIITGQKAENLQIRDNFMVGNGNQGISDAIHLTGFIGQTLINSNFICGNYGSAIYLFKPLGQTKIENNLILNNGLGLHRAAIYLMGSEHQVFNNSITNQNGSGVVVAAYPQSDRNFILGNRFRGLDGLSIDLVTRNHVGIQDFQVGDGINPPRNSENRRLDTANRAINAPQFLSDKFYLIEGKVSLDGKADPHAQITLYQVTEAGSHYGPLNQIIGEIQADSEGKFGITFENIQAGTVISAIANLPETGTSEPAQNTLITSLNNNSPPFYAPNIRPPTCNKSPQLE